jgi:transposase InsO family protein
MLINEATAEGARRSKACKVIGISQRTLQRWQADLSGGGDGVDARKGAPRHVPRRLSDAERQQILSTVNDPRYSALPPAQIVPDLADQGIYIASESSFYRVMHAHGLIHHRGRSKTPRAPRPVPQLTASKPGDVWSWDITLLPSLVVGQWHYLYMVMDIWSRKIVAWEVHERECSSVAEEMIQKACWREGINKQRPVILHSDNSNPMRCFSLGAKLADLGVDRSFSRPRVSNDNPFSESLFRTLKYHPSYPAKRFATIHAAQEWVRGFVDWYINSHRHSGIKFVTPNQRHTGQADAICLKRTQVYNSAKGCHPERWSGEIRGWSQPLEVMINSPRLISSSVVGDRLVA